MIKHLLVAITLLAGCDGYHWFYACDDPNKPPGTVYCTESGGEEGPCEAPGIPYYVWTLDWQCGEVQQLFCSMNDEDAQAYVDANFSDETHGAPSTDPHATEPKWIKMCGSGDCVLGSSNESLGTSFWIFTDDQIAACEMQLDPDCSQWVEADTTTNKCPGEP